MREPRIHRPEASPQLAVRVAVLGVIALAIFAAIFFRLWYLQVLSGDRYLAQASVNRIRVLPTPAPRGRVLDRSGTVLVDNQPAVAIVVVPPRLPERAAARRAVLARLSRVLGKPTAPRACEFGSGDDRVVKRLMPLECLVDQHVAAVPYADVVVRTAASRAVYSYLGERAGEFPGVELRDGWLRDYPLGRAGAHVLGTIGQINAQELEDPRFAGIGGGALVGKSGVERSYDHWLRGRDGAERVQVDAHGAVSRALDPLPAVPGSDLQLSLDARLQQVGERALADGIARARANGNAAGAGAFVALDYESGELLALGSAPSYDPARFTRPMSQDEWERGYGADAGSPLFDRAVDGAYPVGSTFKPVTAVAALATGATTPERVYDDTGTWRSGAQVRRNAGGASFGPVALERALTVSVDTYFYDLGARLNADPVEHPRGGALQQWARRFGFGSATGVDLPSETPGTVPDQRHADELWEAELACRRRERRDDCRIALADHAWTVGDNVSLAIGQGDFQASPLQLATAYAALANGGTVVRPHVGLAVLDWRGQVLQRLTPRAPRRIEIPGLEPIRRGLLGVTADREGTAHAVFDGFGRAVHGKTGTVELDGRPDQSWFVAWVDEPKRPIVVAAVIEDGGFGAKAAAPAVRQILSQWVYGRAGELVAGSARR